METLLYAFDGVFGRVRSLREYMNDHSNDDALIQDGFSQQEAEQLSWFHQHRTNGRAIGLTLGVGLAYTMDSTIRKLNRSFPIMKWNKMLQWGVRGAVVFSTLQFCDYVFTGRRVGTTTTFLNDVMWTNQRYSQSKDAFVQNFLVLNRPFTSEERKQFRYNQTNQNSTSKRRISYNPYLHGEDEELFKKEMLERFVQTVAPWERKDVQQQIAIQNKEKILNGETVRIKPYNILEHFDKSGLKHGLKINTVFENYQVLT